MLYNIYIYLHYIIYIRTIICDAAITNTPRLATRPDSILHTLDTYYNMLESLEIQTAKVYNILQLVECVLAAHC